jgi:hypothetical protein
VSVTAKRHGKRLLVPVGILDTKASRRLVDSELEWNEVVALAAELGFVMCGGCDGPFQPRRADAFYCSSACRQKAYRKRVRS